MSDSAAPVGMGAQLETEKIPHVKTAHAKSLITKSFMFLDYIQPNGFVKLKKIKFQLRLQNES